MNQYENHLNEDPRGRIMNNQMSSISNLELIALLLSFGNKNKSVFDLSNEVLKLIDSIYDLNELTIEELLKIDGIGVAKSTTLLAAIELGKRLSERRIDKSKMTTPSVVFEHFAPLFYDLKQEHLYAMYLDTKGHYINKKLISIGALNSSIVDDKTIFKWAYKYSAAAIIIIHNHPSGDSNPSPEDIIATKALAEKCKMLGFILLDHIIVGNDYYSFKAHFTEL